MSHCAEPVAKKIAMHHRIVTLLALIATMLLAACSGKAPETLSFADLDQPGNAPIFVALAKGYFADENLTVEFKHYTSGRDALAATLSGQTEAGISYDLPIANAISAGTPLRILTTVHRASNYQGLVVRRDRGIESTADLKGRRVGVVPGSGTVYLLHLARLEASLQVDDIVEVPMKPEEGPDLLASGAVDAICTWSPNLEVAMSWLPKGTGKVIYVPAYTQISMLTTTPENLVKKREALQRFVRALVRAEDFIATHDAEARELVTRHLSKQPAEAISRDWNVAHYQLRLDNLMLTSLSNELAWLAGQQTPRGAVPEIAPLLVPDLLAAVRPQAVTLKQP